MLRFKLLALLTVFSGVLSGCLEAKPDVVVCVIDAYNNQLHCSDPRGVVSSIRLSDADNYVCMAPDDFDELVKILNKKCR